MVKLIPRSHRIFMPQHENYRDKKLIVEYYNLFERGVEDKKKFKPLEFASVRQAVPQLIVIFSTILMPMKAILCQKICASFVNF